MLNLLAKTRTMLSALACHFGSGEVELNAGAHRRAEGDALDVLALGSRRLRLHDTGDDGHRVVDQLLRVERELADGNMNQRGLVGAELDLTGLDLFDCAERRRW